MEGKTGLNLVLTVVACLLVAAGVVLCVLFGLGVALSDQLSVSANLFVGLGCIGFGLLLLVACNIAANARITADNSYDTMRYLERLCQREGLTLDDLARKDASFAERIARRKEVARVQAELNEEQQAHAQAVADAAGINEQLRQEQEANALAQQRIEELEAQLEAAASTAAAPAEVPAATVEEATAAAPEVAADTTPAVEPGCGISADEWKTNLAGMGRCGTCGEVVNVRTNSRAGIVALVCKNNGTDACTERPMRIEEFAAKFVAWYNAIYGADGELTAFSMDKFLERVQSFELKDGDILFVAK